MEDIFNIKYNTKLDRLERTKKREKFKILSIIKNHKFLTIILMNLIVFSGINFYLIFNFMKILENI